MLARAGWAASLTRDGLARTDILAVHASAERRMIEVQVKTVRTRSWPRGRKRIEPAISDREWYVPRCRIAVYGADVALPLVPRCDSGVLCIGGVRDER
jgi:hypothetical protein